MAMLMTAKLFQSNRVAMQSSITVADVMMQ